MATLKENLKFWMERRNFKQKALALEAGLNETFVRDILKGKTQHPKFDSFIKLCAALKVMPHELMPEIEQFYPPDALDILEDIAEAREKQIGISAKIAARSKSAKPSN